MCLNQFQTQFYVFESISFCVFHNLHKLDDLTRTIFIWTFVPVVSVYVDFIWQIVKSMYCVISDFVVNGP